MKGTEKTSVSRSDPLYNGYEDWKLWNEMFQFTPEDAAYFAGELCGVKVAGACLLEVGFGSGNFLSWAIAQGAHVAGTEINERSLETARSKGVELISSDFETAVGSHAARFDTIVAFDVFEHFAVDDVRRRLSAADTLLKPGGAFLLRFPNAQSPFGLAPQNGDPTHKSALSRSAIEQLTRGTAFSVERYGTVYRIGGGGLARGLTRRVRALLRDMIGRSLNFIYTQNIPWDPVVVIVLRKAPS